MFDLPHQGRGPPAQAGMVLFISLALLLLLTLVGVASVQTASLQTRLARNAHDNLLAFEAAELALREGEALLADQAPEEARFTAQGLGGLWRPAAFADPSPWTAPGVWLAGSGGSRAVVAPPVGVVAPPRYLIEWLATLEGPENPHLLDESATVQGRRTTIFRITATGFGATANAEARLQSTFALSAPNERRGPLNEAEAQWQSRARNDDRLGPIIGAHPVIVGPPQALGRDQAPYPLAAGDRYGDFARSLRNRPALIYLGANDGTLHAFDADRGEEVFAYAPNRLVDGGQQFATRLERRLAEQDGAHYLLDQRPAVEDAFIRRTAGAQQRAWRTLLIGGFGRSGKGYFALDVTAPGDVFRNAQQAAQSVLWKFGEQDDAYPVMADGRPLVDRGGRPVRDAQGNPVKDLGYALGQARLGMGNVEDADGDKAWLAIFGNGPGSTAARATLFILFVDRGLDGWQAGDFIKLPAAPTGVFGGPANGLGEPALVDLDLNGTVDRVYAGDLQGNLHRFDLSGSSPSAWSGTAIFQARSAEDGATPLPIAARPQVFKHPDKPGFIVVFGTGGEGGLEDEANADIESLFGIWDADDGTGRQASPTAAQSELVQQRITNIRAPLGAAHRRQRIVSNAPVRYRLAGNGGVGVRGWRLDFDAPRAGAALGVAQHPGERIHPRLTSWDDLLFVATVLPGAGGGALLPLSFLNGGSPSRPILDLNEDGELDEADMLKVEGRAYAPGILFDAQAYDGPMLAPRLRPSADGPPQLILAGGGQRQAFALGLPAQARQGRLSWQELTEFD